MAKCPICNSRKGKRKCLATSSFVCSICCGDSRKAEKCAGCSFYKEDKLIRNYSKVPFVSLEQMADDPDLQDYANVMESAICQFDHDHHENLSDKQIFGVLELLLDKYFFGDSIFNFENQLEREGFALIDQAIQDDLRDLSNQEVSKVIGTIYRSIKRRTSVNREYLEFIKQYVGVRVGPGIRVIPHSQVDKR
jgi:hypothetical protein